MKLLEKSVITTETKLVGEADATGYILHVIDPPDTAANKTEHYK